MNILKINIYNIIYIKLEKNKMYKNIIMNFLDLLPDDVMKIINRKVKDLHIIERRKEKKENRKMNREQEEKAYRRRYISNKYVNLYQKYVKIQAWNYCYSLVEMMKKEFGKDHLSSQIFIDDDEPYIISTIQYNGSNYNIKVL